jgi:hypothetical protein
MTSLTLGLILHNMAEFTLGVWEFTYMVLIHFDTKADIKNLVQSQYLGPILIINPSPFFTLPITHYPFPIPGPTKQINIKNLAPRLFTPLSPKSQK